VQHHRFAVPAEPEVPGVAALHDFDYPNPVTYRMGKFTPVKQSAANTHIWSMASSAIVENVATLLPVRLRRERRVSSEHLG
jgi:hypothetical protein